MKKLLAMLLAVMMILSVSAMAEYDKEVFFTVCTTQTQSTGDYNSDPLAQYIAEKFNIDWEVWPVAADSRAEKMRVWVNSGTMPTVITWADFNYAEYLDYVDQGMIAPLPDGWEETYPNLYKAMVQTGAIEKFYVDGVMYGVPHTTFATFIEMDQIPNHYTTFYRKDWAETLGYDFGTNVTMSEFKQYLADCIANNMSGTDSTYGMIADKGYMAQFFMTGTGIRYNGFHETEDGMVWGPTCDAIPETIKTMRQWYQEGMIYPDYYLLASTEVAEYFHIGKCAAITIDGPVSAFYNRMSAMKENGIDPETAFGAVIVTEDDGVVRSHQASNYWSVSLFSPEIDDETMDRMLALTDWLFTEEGVLTCQMGVPGLHWDYDADGNPYYLEAAYDAEGNLANHWDVNPSYRVWRQLGLLSDSFNFVKPGYEYAAELCLGIYNAKGAGEMLPLNLNYDYYASETKSIYSVDINSQITALVISEEDIDSTWDKFIEDNRGMWEPLLNELNAEFYGK